MFDIISRNKLTYVILLIYAILLVWWAKIFFTGVKETDENYLFGFLYPLIALIGSIAGFISSKKWGGSKSLIGRGIIFFSLGLFGLWFGQTVWSYYNLIARVPVPYPSIADIGYFSIIPLYGYGMYCFGKASGIKFSLKSIGGKIIVVLIPIIMVAISYFLFLRNLAPDFSDPLKTFLDFGYPGGEAITISIALLTYFLSRNILGGKMRSRILYIIFALVVQYVTDYLFLYRASAGTYYNAGVVDLMYTASFTVMAIGLLSFKEVE